MRNETQRIAGIAGFPLRSNPAYGLATAGGFFTSSESFSSNTSQLVAGLLSMKVTYRFKVARACVVFLGVPGLSSAWNGAEPSPALLWLFGLPIWVIVPSFITLNMLIFVGVFAAFRCWILPRTTAGRLMRRYRTWITPGFKQLKCQAWHCALAGGLVGSLLAMTLADTWRVLGEMVLY